MRIRFALLAVLLALTVPLSAAIDYTALRTELQTNPTSIAGLSAAVTAGQDCLAASLLNGNTTATNVFQPITTTAMKGAIDPTEFATLSATQLSQITVMLSGDSVDATNTNIRTIVTNIFSPAGSFPTTRANMLALVRRAGTRPEVLFGSGTVLTCDDVRKALGR
jgi:hypothetical protein